MIRYTRFASASSALANYLESTTKKVFSEAQLNSILEENRAKWGFALTTPLNRIIEKLSEKGLFITTTFNLTNGTSIVRYLFQDPSIYEIATSLRSQSYISHFPALLLNDLTSQVAKTIYTTREQSLKPKKAFSISQNTIDAAFSKPQRRSELECRYGDYKVILLESKFSNRTGVITSNNISFTNLERTLIDATVRPNYSGTSFEVLEAYKRALPKGISISKLSAFLKKMDFIYPYHQAIGFYLQKAGYSGSMLETFRRLPRLYKFYLEYGMENPQFSEDWFIYYPKEM